MELHASETDVVKLVGTYIQSFESLAKQKNITLNFKAEEEKIKAYIDREKFEQVLNNLLSNAFKFTGEGGEIEVAVTPSNKLSFRSRPSGREIPQQFTTTTSRFLSCKARIRNDRENGRKGKSRSALQFQSPTPAVASTEHINHIFDRFYQAGQENNSYYEGTGIGLALTKELVELHHGTIKVESEPRKRDQHSQFYFHLVKIT